MESIWYQIQIKHLPIYFHIHYKCELFPSYSALALATALVPSFDNSSSKLFPIPVNDTSEEFKKEMHEALRSHCEVQGHEEWDTLYFSVRKDGFLRDVIEPRTRIKYPTALASLGLWTK